MTNSLLSQQLDALLTNETNFIANLSNASALLYQSLSDINWAGFYLYDEINDELHLGPFKEKLHVCILKMALVFVALHCNNKKFYA